MSAQQRQLLGSSERLFTAFRRFAPTNLVRVMAIEGSLPPERIRRVLPVLQARHPLLNVRVVDGRRPAFVPAEQAPVQLRVTERRGSGQWRALLEQLLNTPLAREPGPLLELHYLYAAGQPRAELFVVCDHVICDGVSVNALCAELLALCAGEPPGPACQPLPVLDALMPRFTAWQRASDFSQVLATFVRGAALRHLHEPVAAGRTTGFLTRTLTLDQTEALIAQSRAEHTTLTGALMAAALRAIHEARVSAPRLSLGVPVNLRPHLTDHQLGPHDLGNLTNVVYVGEEASGDAFWPSARALKQRLTQVTAQRRLLSALSLTYRTGRLFVRSSRPPFAHALISNSGVVPLRSEYGAFRPVDFFSANSAPMLSADFGLFCNTFGGRLRLNLVFLEEVVARPVARQVLDAMIGRLSVPGARTPSLPIPPAMPNLTQPRPRLRSSG